MKKTISQTKGRFRDGNDINSEFITDLSTHEGDRIGYKLVFVDNTEYMIVFDSFPQTSFDGRIITHIKHYSRFSSTEKWNSVDDDNIDSVMFENKRSIVTDSKLYIDMNTGILHDINDEFIYENDIEIKNENGDSYIPPRYTKKIKTNIVLYYNVIRYSPLGLGMETAVFDDMEKRLLSLKN